MKKRSQLNLNASLAFVEVARTGGFRKAAVALGIPASTVSNHVARLEKSLGVKLLDRTTRSVRLTDAGQTYLKPPRPALEALADAAQAALDVTATPAGNLRVSMPIEFGHMYLANIVRKYTHEFPQVTLNCNLSNRRVNLLDEGYDVAVRAGRLSDSSLICRAVGPTQRLVTCASPQYISRRGAPVKPQDLTQHDCLTMSDISATDSWTYRVSRKNSSVLLDPYMSVNNYFALKDLALLGLGIIRIPRFLIVAELEMGALHEVLPTMAIPGLAFHVLYPNSGRLSPKIKGFVSVVDKAISQ